MNNLKSGSWPETENTICVMSQTRLKLYMDVENNSNLKLKKEFNSDQYKIDTIHKTDPGETSSIPVRI